ncbi:hypothetical protein SAMN05421813_12836 [Daejeonella rubra]|uniref:Uncharacterized protein n=1 Tax=Daejeonella rubra TaxID=990371 RepID=A0A1G9X463_9SPHI|nr:hypothetical protein [Daejeonella rubra]SDM91133.1 hypothetical protein SAMN05421813_12836 [Daejeonella rubra]
MDSINFILSNFYYSVALLLSISFFLHYFLVYPKNLSKKQWKYMDYVWLSLTVIGLVAPTRSAERTASEIKVSTLRPALIMNLQLIKSYFNRGDTSWICEGIMKPYNGPANFDELDRDWKTMCIWEKEMQIIVDKIDTVTFKVINLDSVPKANVQLDMFLRHEEVIIDRIKYYNSDASEFQVASKLAHETTKDLVWNLLSPLLLIIGIALRLTKVSGEIRHEN